MKLAFPVYLLGSLLAPTTSAWGTEGRQIIATLAQIHLYPDVRLALKDILAEEYEGHLANVANWADWARNQDEWEYTAPMDFANAKNDIPAERCYSSTSAWEIVKCSWPIRYFFGYPWETAAPQTSDTLVCPYNWAKGIHPLNCDIVRPKKFDETKRHRFEVTSDKYLGRIGEEKVIERLFAMAGLRLAKVINEAVGAERYPGVYLAWQKDAPEVDESH